MNLNFNPWKLKFSSSSSSSLSLSAASFAHNILIVYMACVHQAL